DRDHDLPLARDPFCQRLFLSRLLTLRYARSVPPLADMNCTWLLWDSARCEQHSDELRHTTGSLVRMASAAMPCSTTRGGRAPSMPEPKPRPSAIAITSSATGSDGLLVIKKTMPSKTAAAVCGVVTRTGSWVRANSAAGSGPSGASRASWA